MHLVLIETSGNQRYIFATNKLRENVGASELTYQAGTKIILESVKRKYDYKNDRGGSQLRKLLLNETTIENATDENAVEIIVATSGKSILLTKNEEKANEIVREISKRVLIEMPGLTVHGAIVKVGKDEQTGQEKLKDIHNAIGKVHRKLERIRHQMPTNEQRFLRLPFVAPCATSGLPAQNFGKEGNNKLLLSDLSMEKRNAYARSQKRLQEVVNWYREEESVATDIHLISSVGNLETLYDLKWLAVVHADGNGLGEIFLNFNKYAGFDENGEWSGRLYLDEYRKFSIALDICTIKATGTALKNLQKSYEKDNPQQQSIEIPVVPLVLGGDDLTVFCDGQYAIKFARDFLIAFEAETQKSHTLVGDIIRKIANKAFNQDYLGICAGIAIIKPHYPFHQAYKLAEQLLKSAKQVKEKIKHKWKKDDETEKKETALPSSSLDFHILYDSAHSDLDEIQEKLTIGNTLLSAKPYIVSEISEKEIGFIGDLDEKRAEDSRKWLKHRKFNELKNRIEAMLKPAVNDATGQALPNSKMHEIRESLFRGKDTAKTEVGLIQNRLCKESQDVFKKLLSEDSIFFDESGKNYTHFLDAIEAVELWKGFGCESSENSATGGEKE